MRLTTYTPAATAEAMDFVHGNHGETAIIILTHRLPVDGGMWVTAADTARNITGIGSRHLIVIQLDIAHRLGGLIAAADGTLLTFVDISITLHVTNVLGQIKPVLLIRLIMPYTTDTKDIVLRTEAAI